LAIIEARIDVDGWKDQECEDWIEDELPRVHDVIREAVKNEVKHLRNISVKVSS